MEGSQSSTLSRRRLLRSGATGLAAVAAGSAGCVSGLPPLGNQIEFGRVDSPAASGSSEYRRWLADPESAPGRVGGSSPTVLTPKAFEGDPQAQRTSIGRSVVMARQDYLGRPFESYDLAVANRGVVVLEGNFERASIESFLADTRYALAGQYHDYVLYDRPDGNRVLAIDDGTIVSGRGTESRAAVEYVVEVGAGERPRYHEVDDTFGQFSDAVGTSPAVMFGFGLTEAAVEPLHTSLSLRFDEEAVYYVHQQLYPDDVDIPESTVREDLRNMRRNFESALVEIESDGRFLTVVIRVGRSSIEDRRDLPDIMWAWDKDQANRTITLHHEVGDSFDASHVEILHDGDPTDAQFADEHDTVGPGDSITVEVPDEFGTDSINVMMDLGGGSSSTILFVDLEESP